jgi:hypothetical protein
MRHKDGKVDAKSDVIKNDQYLFALPFIDGNSGSIELEFFFILYKEE